MARYAELRALPDDRLTQIRENYTGQQQRINQLIEQADTLLRASSSTLLTREVEKTVLRGRERLDRWMRDLSVRSAARQVDVQKVKVC
jgi:phenylalanyl-tRNA synthetase alpha subunit